MCILKEPLVGCVFLQTSHKYLIFFFFFLAHFSWLFWLTAHGGHQGWEGGGAWRGGAEEVKMEDGRREAQHIHLWSAKQYLKRDTNNFIDDNTPWKTSLETHESRDFTTRVSMHGGDLVDRAMNNSLYLIDVYSFYGSVPLSKQTSCNLQKTLGKLPNLRIFLQSLHMIE